MFTKDVAESFIDCSGSNNTIASNFMIRDSEIVNAYLNVEGESNLIYNNTMKNCIIEVSGYKNMVLNNNFTNGRLVINKDSFNCTISNQRIESLSLMGFYNTIYENEIAGMEIGGTHGSSDSANNSFYKNNFMEIPPEIRINTKTPGPIIWDNGLEGNYWVGYAGSDVNDDGIGDVPYEVNAAYSYFNGARREESTVLCGQDNFPLMQPVQINNVIIEVPKATNLHPALPTDFNLQQMLSQIAIAVTVLAIVAVLTLLLLKRHRKTANIM